VRTLSIAPLLAVVLPLAGPAAVGAATPAQVVRAHHTAAVTAADRALGNLALPAGATEVSAEPKGDAHQLARPMYLLVFAAAVDRHRYWTTNVSPREVIASIEAHLPAGTESAGSAYSGTSIFASYSLPSVTPPTLGRRDLAVNAVVLSGGRTGVRADVAVTYSAPRLRAQRVPPRARVLEIAIANPRAAPLLSLTVTDRAQIRRIAAIVDGLPFAASLRGVAISCPALTVAPVDPFTFRSSPHGPALATVSEPANNPTGAEPCFTAAFTIRGHHERGLLEGGMLLRRASAILGVKLTRP
jgi:hypothetical protein